MSRNVTETNRLAQRALASAVGVAVSTLGGGSIAMAAETPAKDKAIALDATEVSSERNDEGYKVDSSASNKFTAPLRETPKSVTVISEQVIKDTGSLSLADALRTTSGITFGAGEGGNPAGDRPIIRGFNAESDIFVDGMRDLGAQNREIFDIEQVEVSKGPGSAFTGAGSTGGSLNLISKTAKLQDFADASFTYGSDQTRRYTLDVNRKLTDNIAGRLNLMQHDANVAGRDGVNVSRWGVAPTISFGLNTPTRATLSYYHLETDDMPDYGIPLTTNSATNFNRRPISVDRDNFYGLNDRDFRKSTDDAGTFKIEHDLNDAVTISNSIRFTRKTLDLIVTNPDDSQGNVNNGLVYRSSKNRKSTSDGWVNQTALTAAFDTAFIQHSATAGIEAAKQGVHNHGYTVTKGATGGGASGNTCNAALLASGDCTSLSNPNPHDNWTGTVARSVTSTDTDTDTLSAYAFDTLKFNDQWSLNLGVRYDDYGTDSKGVNTQTGVITRMENNSHFWNYQTGLVFNPLPNGSIYIAWSTSSNPSGETGGEGNDSLSATNQILEPERNRNYEIGTKWDFFDERLGLTAALFKTQKTNARVTNADGFLENIGETEVKGFEIGITGKITSKWDVMANYTRLDSEIVDSGRVDVNPTSAVTTNVVGGFNGNEVPNTPENSLSMWTTYQVMPRLSIGGGAIYVDSRYGDTGNFVQVPDYWRYDAMAKFVVSKNLDLQLNVQNLTDKRYFDQVFQTHYAHVAPGRTALLSTNFHF